MFADCVYRQIALFFFTLVIHFRHLLFDKFAQSVAKMNKFWAKNGVFLPANVHQMVSSKNNNNKLQFMNFGNFLHVSVVS